MKGLKNIVTGIVILIVLLASLSSIAGIRAWPDLKSTIEYTSPRGDTTHILTRGIYKYNPDWFVAEGIAWDFVTLFFSIPLLFLGLFLYLKGNNRGYFILIAMFVYCAYTYLLYGTGWAFNELFLVYTSIVSLALIGLALIGYQLLISKKNYFDYETTRAPIKGIAIFSLIIGLFIAKMWVSLIIPIIQAGNTNMPAAFAGMNSLVVQVFDLSIILPLTILTAMALFKKLKGAIILAYIIIVKGMVMSLAISAMVIVKGLLKGKIPCNEMIPFILFFLIAGYFFIALMRDKNL